MTVEAEVQRSERYSPGSVEPVAVFEALEQLAPGGIDIDEAQAGAGSFEGIAGEVQGVGDDDVVANGLDIEGDEVGRQTIVRERLVVVFEEALVVGMAPVVITVVIVVALQLYGLEGIVVDVDALLEEVGARRGNGCRR